SSTVTITMTGSTYPTWIAVSEWTGLLGTATLDVARVNDGLTSPAASGVITTSYADLLLFAATDEAPNTWGMPTPAGWTAMTGVTSLYTQVAWYRIQMTPAQIGPTVSETSHSWDAAIAGLRIAP